MTGRWHIAVLALLCWPGALAAQTGEPTAAAPAPAAQRAPLPDSDAPAQAEPAPAADPSAALDPLREAAPAAATDAALEADASAGPDQALEAEPSAGTDPALEADAATQADPMLEAAPALNTEPAAGMDPGLEADASAGTDPALEADAAAQADPMLEAAEAAIDAMEAEAGAFAPAVAQAVVYAADRFREAGQLRQALRLYRRHQLLIRVNEGLYSLAQVPTLETILELQASLGDWKAVNGSQEHLLWLFRRNFPSGSPELLPALKRLRNWHVNAFGVDTGMDLDYHYQTADALYKEGIGIITANGGSRREALCFWHAECCREDANPARVRGCPRELRKR